MGDLDIPDEALAAFPDGVLPSARRATVRAIAGPVVAAYLRRLATVREFADVQAELRHLAWELDGGTS